MKHSKRNTDFDFIHPKQTNNVEYCQIKMNASIDVDNKSQSKINNCLFFKWLMLNSDGIM